MTMSCARRPASPNRRHHLFSPATPLHQPIAQSTPPTRHVVRPGGGGDAPSLSSIAASHIQTPPLERRPPAGALLCCRCAASMLGMHPAKCREWCHGPGHGLGARSHGLQSSLQPDCLRSIWWEGGRQRERERERKPPACTSLGARWAGAKVGLEDGQA